MMNVVVNPNGIVWFEKIFGIITIVLWIILLWYSFLKDKKSFISYSKELVLFLVWLIIVLIPWIWKNISEWYPNLNISTIIWWKTDDFTVDFKTIYSEKEYNSISEEKNNVRKK